MATQPALTERLIVAVRAIARAPLDVWRFSTRRIFDLGQIRLEAQFTDYRFQVVDVVDSRAFQPLPDDAAVLLFAVGYGLSEWRSAPDTGIVDWTTGSTLVGLQIDNTGYLPFLAEVRRAADGGLILPPRARATVQTREGFYITSDAHHDVPFARFHGYHAAGRKSVELLKEWLDPEQLAQFEKTQTFDVIGGTSGRRYTIEYASRSSNVVGHELQSCLWRSSTPPRLCFGPAGILAPGDIMLAQKIALEKDEPTALKVAVYS